MTEPLNNPPPREREAAGGAIAGRPASFWRRIWRRYLRYPLGVAGLVTVGVMFVVAFGAPLLANKDPLVCRYQGRIYFPAVIETIQNIPLAAWVVRKDLPFRRADFDFKDAYQPARGDWALWAPVHFGPLEIAALPLNPPSSEHLLGTDEVGRDILARMIHGTGVSMKVGFISMGIAVVIGLFFGAIAGYVGGWSDIAISRFIEIVMCFPTFFLILAILAWFPPRIENVMIVIGLTSWVGIARYARGEILKLREQDYAYAAKALGASHGRIIFRHLLPNSLAPVMVSVTFGIASAILVEAGLSWLGFGVQPPYPSWGNILRSAYDNLFTAPYMILPPCVAIFIAVLAFNLVGDALRDVVDPRLQ
ncbi:MAG: ABC transporter permease [bacterium]|nr:ABC transporter permease [bacterium]